MKKSLVILGVFALLFLIQNVDAKAINCGDNWQCFVENAETCTLSKYRDTRTGDFFGLGTLNIDWLWKIRPSGDSCELFIRYNKFEFKFSDEIKELILEGGLTEREIRKAEIEQSDEIRKLYGTRVYRFDKEDFDSVFLMEEESPVVFFDDSMLKGIDRFEKLDED